MEEHGRERTWVMQVTALYDYEPEERDELGFFEGDVLRVIHVQDDGWWAGYNIENPDVVGLFPSNYMQAQRSSISPQKKSIIDATRLPGGSRRRIQIDERPPDTPEFDEEEDDEVPELRSEYRGHIGNVLQLRKNLEEAERASAAARDARRQMEQEKIRYSKSWRDMQDGNEDEEVNQDDEVPNVSQRNGIDVATDDDDDDASYPRQQGYMHSHDDPMLEETQSHNNYAHGAENNVQQHSEEENEQAAAKLITRTVRSYTAVVQRIREQSEKQKELQAAGIVIQRWAAQAYSIQKERRRAERNTARRGYEAASVIQKWIRLRWACFWRRRVRIERDASEAILNQEKETLRRQAELEETLRRQEMFLEEQRCQDEEESRQQEEEKLRQLQAEEEKRLQQQIQTEELRQQLKNTVEQEVQRRLQQETAAEADRQELEISSPQTQSPAKPRRKVMKKEAVELIKTLVHQQLDETLRDHDAKMDELQRMVAKLQTVVRKQTAMLQDSADQLTWRENHPVAPPRHNESGSFLPRIGTQSSMPRQPVAPSGLRAPRPVMLSKLPMLGGVRQGSSNQSSTKKRW